MGDVEVVPDRVEGKGPLGGLHAALLEARARGLEGVFLLACDLPLVDEALVRRIAEGLDGAAASAPEGEAEGSVEPLCAAWSLEVLPEAERRLQGEDVSLHGLFRTMDGRRLPRAVERGGVDPLLNVNTPADRKRAEDALGGRESP